MKYWFWYANTFMPILLYIGSRILETWKKWKRFFCYPYNIIEYYKQKLDFAIQIWQFRERKKNRGIFEDLLYV